MQFTKGNEIYDVGLCASTNWEILENSNSNDIWVHLADFPSCYVICKWNDNITFPTKAKKKKYIQQRVKEAGHICCVKSENKIPDNLNKIDIVYLKCKYVKKGQKVGQAELTKDPIMLTINRN